MARNQNALLPKLLLLFALLPFVASAQTSLFLRNNSWLDFQISLRQGGSHTATAFTQIETALPNWQEDFEVFNTARDTSLLPAGDSVIYSIVLHAAGDSIEMQLRLLPTPGGSSLDFRLIAPGAVPGAWLNDGAFHQTTATIGGLDLILKFKPDNDDSQLARNLRLAIHQTPIYSIAPSDFSNPNIINLMAYNVQFLPLGLVGLPQAADRGDLLPAEFSPSQDVIIFAEAFDPIPRLFNLIPAMQAAGFSHNSGILNDYLPFNGGIIIFSRWPIEATAQYDFALCGPASQDCLANKGIMYARINKLGKRYHVFGTHFDAGSDSLDLAAKNLQYREMHDFIAAQNIPETEAVLMGGDLNTSPIDGHNLYSNMLDSLDPVVPQYGGFQNSTMRVDTGDIIDHIFTDHRHLLPLEANVSIETFRSIDDALWELNNFSDHRAAVGRFLFPDIQSGPGDQQACPGDSAHFTALGNIPMTYTWLQNGLIHPNHTPFLTIPSAQPADSGTYACQLGYAMTYGTATDPVNSLFYPNGPVTRTFDGSIQVGHLAVDPAFCPTVRESPAGFSFSLHPNPSNGDLHLSCRNLAGVGTYVLRDMQGHTHLHGTCLNSTSLLDLGDLPDGIYLFEIVTRNGQREIQKLVLAR